MLTEMSQATWQVLAMDALATGPVSRELADWTLHWLMVEPSRLRLRYRKQHIPWEISGRLVEHLAPACSGQSFAILQPAIESLIQDSHPAVRVSGIVACLPVLNIDRQQAIRWFLSACEGPEELLATSHAAEFMRYTICSDLAEFRELVKRMVMVALCCPFPTACWRQAIPLPTSLPKSHVTTRAASSAKSAFTWCPSSCVSMSSRRGRSTSFTKTVSICGTYSWSGGLDGPWS